MGTYAYTLLNNIPEGNQSQYSSTVLVDSGSASGNIFVYNYTINKFYKYNISDNTITFLNPITESGLLLTYSTCPLAMWFNSANNKIYIFGVAYTTGNVNTKKFITYNITTGLWENGTVYVSNNDDGAYGCYYYNGYVYLVHDSSIIRFNPGNNDISTLLLSGISKKYSASVGIGDKIYTYGHNSSGNIAMYDISNNTINESLTTVNQNNESKPAMIAVGSKIYIFGVYSPSSPPTGADTRNLLKIVDTNSPYSLTIDTLVQTLGVYNTTPQAYDGNIYLIGGSQTNTQTGQTAIQVYTYILDAPSGVTASYSVGTNSITINWIDNSLEETDYIIKRKRDDETVYTILDMLPAGTLTYNDTNNIDVLNHTYTYQIIARKVV